MLHSLITSGSGRPDENRAARLIISDYATGKLVFNHPPPFVLPEYAPHFEKQGVEDVLVKRANAKAEGLAHLPASIQANLEDVEPTG
jgi:hypothetical protein